MSIWDNQGKRKAVARKVAPYFWIVTGGLLFSVCLAMLWSAYTTHAIFMPLRRTARYFVLERDPGFFWASVVVYVVVGLCAPVSIMSQTADIRFRSRTGR